MAVVLEKVSRKQSMIFWTMALCQEQDRQLTWACVETRLYRRSESCFALTSSALLATALALNRRQFGPIRSSFTKFGMKLRQDVDENEDDDDDGDFSR